MNITKHLRQSFQIISLNKHEINQVAHHGSTWLAVFLFGFWSLIAGLFMKDYISAIGWFFEAIILTYVVASIYYLCAIMFKSKTDFNHLYRPWGYAQLFVGISFLINKLFSTNFALILSIILEIWCIIIAYTIIKNQFHLKSWKALITVLVPIIILVIIVMTNSTVLLNIVSSSGLVSGLVF